MLHDGFRLGYLQGINHLAEVCRQGTRVPAGTEPAPKHQAHVRRVHRTTQRYGEHVQQDGQAGNPGADAFQRTHK